MRKIVLYMYSTLDGLIAGLNDEFDDYEPSAEEHEYANQLFAGADGVMFGRLTYEGFISYWDTLDLSDPSIPTAELEFAKIFRTKPRIVFSKTLRQLEDNATLIHENFAIEVAKLKEQTGSYYILICGPELLAALTQLDLVDEYRIMIKPKILGKGRALFSDVQKTLSLTLLSTKIFASGTVMHCYGNV